MNIYNLRPFSTKMFYFACITLCIRVSDYDSDSCTSSSPSAPKNTSNEQSLMLYEYARLISRYPRFNIDDIFLLPIQRTGKLPLHKKMVSKPVTINSTLIKICVMVKKQREWMGEKLALLRPQKNQICQQINHNLAGAHEITEFNKWRYHHKQKTISLAIFDKFIITRKNLEEMKLNHSATYKIISCLEILLKKHTSTIKKTEHLRVKSMCLINALSNLLTSYAKSYNLYEAMYVDHYKHEYNVDRTDDYRWLYKRNSEPIIGSIKKQHAEFKVILNEIEVKKNLCMNMKKLCKVA